MQIRAGTAAVQNGSALVIGDIDADWTAATVGSLFGIQTEVVSYQIGAKRSPGVSGSGFWELDLTAPYAGDDNELAAYAISVDFSAVFGLPLFSYGDVNSAQNLSRLVGQLDSLLALASLVKFHPAVTAAQGGGAGDLDAQATALLTVPRLWLYRDGTSGALRGFFLIAGTAAESGDDIVHPVDYASGTNEKILVSAL